MIDFTKLIETLSVRWDRILNVDGEEIEVEMVPERYYCALTETESRAGELVVSGVDAWPKEANPMPEEGIWDIVCSLDFVPWGRKYLRLDGLMITDLDAAGFEPGETEMLIDRALGSDMVPMAIFVVNGRRMLVLRRVDSSYRWKTDAWGEALKAFVGPFVDLSMPGVRLAVRGRSDKVAPAPVKRTVWVREELPHWRLVAMHEAAETGVAAFEKSVTLVEATEKRTRSIMMPGDSQAKMLMASGRFDGEIEIEGTPWRIKGTEIVEYVEKPRYDTSGEVVGVRIVKKEKAAVVGLDMDHGKYAFFE